MDDANTEVKNPQPQVGVNPPAPVSNPVKEGEPLITPMVSSESETAVSSELKEIGVESITDRPNLTEEHAQIGVRVSEKPPMETPAVSSPVNFKIPLTNEEIILAPKRSIFDAVRWLASSISRQFKRAIFNKQKQQTTSGQV